ncbi:ZN572 protein, partial [Scytalopus superciliaris]|nr:ZN572 protein [Scytalopus superciliaris]
SFSQSADLVVQQWLHTRDRPYKCLESEKSFSNSSDLTTHQCLHIREKLCKCPDYGK